MATDKVVIGLSVFMAVIGVGLMVAGIASDHWVSANLRSRNESSNNPDTAAVTFGLFKGEASYDFVGPRELDVEIQCDLSESVCGYTMTKLGDSVGNKFEEQVRKYKNGTGSMTSYGLFGLGLFASSLSLLCLSMLFGLMAVGFGLFNVFGRPIETITGLSGLYLWNGLALLCGGLGVALYAALFLTDLSETFINLEQFKVAGIVWKESKELRYSFYCSVGSVGAFVVNMALLVLGARRCGCNYGNAAEKEVDNGIILY